MQLQPTHQQSQSESKLKDYLARLDISNPRQTTINMDDVRKFSPELAQTIISHPLDYYPVIKKYMETLIRNQDEQQYRSSHQNKMNHFNVGFKGNLGENFVTPRGLKSQLSNQLVGVHGLITKMEMPKNFLQKSVHWCQTTKSYSIKQYQDPFSLQGNNLNKARYIRSYDQNQNPMQFQYGLSSFRNIQHATLQQLPENSPPGQLPMSVQIVLQNDLCGRIKPGDRIQAIGVYMLLAGEKTKKYGVFDRYFVILSIQVLEKQYIIKKSIRNNFPKPEERYKICSNSIAPAITGHQMIKKAILLMLIGGNQLTVNETHIRGDINVLLIGDPGTGKSQLLRYVLSNFQRSIGTTGSGASGVGLTAAIISDPRTKQKTIEAGAMVLADRGVVCIDQFDKMNQTDRVAIHQAMQQQTITISKAGILCSLNSRCSVLAAANPIYGEYQQNLTLDKNIGMPDSLLSRFDLVFIINDQKTRQHDMKVSQRVVKNHLMGKILGNQRESYETQDQSFIIKPIQAQQTQVQTFQKQFQKKGERNQILSQHSLKTYIYQCKLLRPQISLEAKKLISLMYSFLRSCYEKNQLTRGQSIQIIPITPRTCDSLIRLSEAHAKVRESDIVTIKDCQEAFKLVVYALTKSEDTFDSQLEQMIRKVRDGTEDMLQDDEEQYKPDSRRRKKVNADEIDYDKLIEEEGKEQSNIKKGGKGKFLAQQKIQNNEEQTPLRSGKGMPKKLNTSIIDNQQAQDKLKSLLSVSSTPLESSKRRALKSTVYSQISKMTSKSRQGKCGVKDLIKKLQQGDSHIAAKHIEQMIEQLDNDKKIIIDENEKDRFIYMI